MKSILQFLVLVGLSVCTTSLVTASESYDEPFRPQFHFTPAKNWMNDPNGMVFYKGEYHLFYQHNPFGDKWGHMSWGHAISRDLMHWKHLPVAIPEENDVMIFSGSAVVDWKNTSGFGKDGEPPLIAIYTGHHTKKPLQNQHIAYSNDRGRTWAKYAGNPVLDIGLQDFRDPKVIWHDATQRWIMIVALPVQHKIAFYASEDLKQWTSLSDFGPAGASKEIWECPDLFPLTIEGTRQKKWVLIVNTFGAPAGGSGCQYFVGDFDGTNFVLDANSHKAEAEVVPEGRLFADFEGTNYNQWTKTGTAFGDAPARGTLTQQQQVGGFRGHGLVNSYLGGDQPEGTLNSPEFEITHHYINFLVGGGNHPGKACVNLSIDGKIERTATGDDSEALAWKSWDVRQYRGKRASIQIVDNATSGWGHINVDHILLANAPVKSAVDGALWADFGPDFYAAVSWSDIPKRDGRRLWLGWMSNWHYATEVPTSPWRSAMSFPRELTLRQTSNGLRLAQRPVRELSQLRQGSHQIRNGSVDEANEWWRRNHIVGGLCEIEAEFNVSSTNGEFGMKLLQAPEQKTIITCDPKNQTLSLDRTRSGRTDFHPKFSGRYQAPLPMDGETVRLHILIDTSSIEVLAADGTTVLTALVLPNESNIPMQLWSADGSLKIERMKIWKLKPAVPISLAPASSRN